MSVDTNKSSSDNQSKQDLSAQDLSAQDLLSPDLSSVLIVEREPPVAWFKLNRPKVMNALNRDLLKALCAACEAVRNDPQVVVVVIIGSGDKAFCAGADLTERKSMTQAETLDYLALIQKTMKTIETLPKVVIAALNGNAFGGGTELALACDLRMMVDDASMRLTEVKLGIIPGAGGTQRLPRLIGKSRAKEMIFTAAPITARQGIECGLVHKVVDDKRLDESETFHRPLMDAAAAWAKQIATGAPLSLRYAKQAIDEGFDRDLDAGLALEVVNYLKLINSRDRQEGLKAFAEKRQPEYIGE